MLQSRALGFWETFKAITHDACEGFETICMATKFIAKMDESLFRNALEFTYNRHPLLQATISEKNNIYYYEFNNSFADIPVQFTNGVSEEVWQQSLYEGANCSVEPEKYLWKVDVFYEANRVIFTLVIHHSPCDGKSLINILDDVLYAYSCYLANEIPNRPNLPLLPPTEQMLVKNTTFQSYMKQREEILVATTQKNSRLSLGPQQSFAPLQQRSTHTIYKELSEQQSIKILDFCLKNKFTTNALFNSLMLIAAQRVEGSSLALAMHTPVHIKPPMDKAQVGCHVCLVTTLYENLNSNSHLLDISHEYQRKLKKEIPKQANLPSEFSKAEVCHAFGLTLNLDFYKYQLVVSNIGEITMQKYKNVAVEKIQASVNNRAGAVACVLITYMLHNKIQFAFVYTKPLISGDYIENFSKEFMQLICAL